MQELFLSKREKYKIYLIMYINKRINKNLVNRVEVKLLKIRKIDKQKIISKC